MFALGRRLKDKDGRSRSFSANDAVEDTVAVDPFAKLDATFVESDDSDEEADGEEPPFKHQSGRLSRHGSGRWTGRNSFRLKRRQIKVDLCPSVTLDMVRRVFAEVTRQCGFQPEHCVGDGIYITHVVEVRKPSGRSKKEVRIQFPVVQELTVRNYGKGSASYSTVYLCWQHLGPKTSCERPSGSGLPRLRSAPTFALKQSLVNGKKARLAKTLEPIIEELIGRWRATLFQKQYALEAATLENNADAPWRSLMPDEVDYEDSDDEGPSPKLFRPKSALKLPSDTSSQLHGPLRTRSVKFSESDKVDILEMTRDHREARMSAGCFATNAYGQVRPLISTRTGVLIAPASDPKESNENVHRPSETPINNLKDLNAYELEELLLQKEKELRRQRRRERRRPRPKLEKKCSGLNVGEDRTKDHNDKTNWDYSGTMPTKERGPRPDSVSDVGPVVQSYSSLPPGRESARAYSPEQQPSQQRRRPTTGRVVGCA
ncbi:Hypothetical Protein FCC1311_080822 [Hondaea fermentalgiana]|uniref:Uncharacterized protein n=1 Tax=Hondaea fermentalgiana TaxID=2315210 RepID=A0A2R5GLU8_9STRA|nr:Hypothetical Protein FCC1311_080822 [Hondaea fermentalgiana]|eukprot:GBG31857.1 Hypothetical Protein FCC1311_080822 [Hondaea fermentalgiana]